MGNHAKHAEKFVNNDSRTDWHDESLWYVRNKRDKAAHAIDEWEELRELASQIKTHTLTKLSDYLREFEANATKNGVVVHWAKDAKEHNEIVLKILQAKNIDRVVKSKSMLTEECHLNQFLESKNIEIVDTDLGEWIVQLKNQPPSHIVMPAIHLKKEEIGQLFKEKNITDIESDDPEFLTLASRVFLRKKFQLSKAAITGVNFAIAETGEVVVCTNEGNADMGVHFSEVSIHCMGLEKIIPKRKHLGVFTRLLARSATGQNITVYTSHHRRPEKGQEKHVILLDNGRSERIHDDDFWTALKCIRCGACMNTCPIYRRSGGYSYDYTIPGPIGSILAPSVDLEAHGDLPFASTLCGSCTDVCPVKIDLHEQLFRWRQIISKKQGANTLRELTNKATSLVLFNRNLYNLSTGLMKYVPSFILNSKLNKWSKGRKTPKISNTSFKSWLKNKNKL
ncbi:MAG: lactate utilization protein B [Saprospiraceae bacterium]